MDIVPIEEMHAAVKQFKACGEPETSVEHYASKVYYASSYEKEVIGAQVVLMSRFIDEVAHPLTSAILYALLPVSLQVAAKFHSDIFYQNKCIARLAGIPLSSLNELELVFLDVLQWKVGVTREDYETATHYIEAMQHNSEPAQHHPHPPPLPRQPQRNPQEPLQGSEAAVGTAPVVPTPPAGGKPCHRKRFSFAPTWAGAPAPSHAADTAQHAC